MTRDEARALLSTMVEATTVEPLLSTADLDLALTLSLVVDPEGRPPTDPDYVETFDLYYAAAECMLIRAQRASMRGGVTEFSSEGSSFKTTGPDWYGLARLWRSRSPLYDGSGFGLLTLESEPLLIPRSEVYPRGESNADFE